MKKVISLNKKISGIIYNNKRYAGVPKNPAMKHMYDFAFYSYEPSADAEQTTGYPMTITVSTKSFKLYFKDNMFKPLNYLPNYKFILKNVTNKEITDLKLVYDGNYLFHIEGTFDSSNLYVTSKYSTSAITLTLLDENNNCFVSDIEIFTSSISTTSQTVSFVSSTLTSAYEHVFNDIEEEIVLPHLINEFIPAVRYLLNSSNTTISATVSHQIL